jgi:Ulp1 family protease
MDFSGGDSGFHNGVQVPQQENDFDCGLFALSYIRALAQGGEARFAFDKSQFDSVRRRVVWELAKNTLLKGL